MVNLGPMLCNLPLSEAMVAVVVRILIAGATELTDPPNYGFSH